MSFSSPIRIIGTGSYAPPRVVTNEELEASGTSSAEWVKKNLGIHERRIAEPNVTTSDLAVRAGRKALEAAGLDADDVDMIIVATSTPDRLAPSTAAIVSHKLGGTRHRPSFDIAAVCSGFVYGLAVAAQFVSSGSCQNILVIGADTYSKITDWSTRDCVYFGDGAGAAVITRGEPGYGILSMELGTDGSGWDIFTVPAGGAETPASDDTVASKAHCFRLDGRRVRQFAENAIPPAIGRVLQQAKLKAEQIDVVIPHQAGIGALRSTLGRTQIPIEKVATIMDRYANTAGGSVPLALDEWIRADKIKRGDHVLFCAFGSGMTWGICTLRWM